MIKYLAQFIPEELKEKSGSVFYSGENAFSGKKNLYILGLNPGGSVTNHKEHTIKYHTDCILNKNNPNYSEYEDGIWNKRGPGKAVLQERVKCLVKQIELNSREIPSSNVCFVRSKSQAELGKELTEYSELCWAFHQNVIEKLDIKTILCFGQKAGKFVKEKIKANTLIDELIEDNNRKWRTRVYRNSNGQIVIIATHPSRADWRSPQTSITSIVRKYV